MLPKFLLDSDIFAEQRRSMAVSPNILPLLLELKRELNKLYSDHLAGTILFGSHARGDENPDSDVDVVILLSGMSVSPFTEIDRMGNIVRHLNDKYAQLIIPMPMDKAYFEQHNFPILKSIKKEGIWV